MLDKPIIPWIEHGIPIMQNVLYHVGCMDIYLIYLKLQSLFFIFIRLFLNNASSHEDTMVGL